LHSKNTTPDWEGHEPDTSARLLDVLITATTGSAKVSQADRVLFVACEFWAAARNHSLAEQLGQGAVAQLREAEEAFTVIGLSSTAGYLRLGRLSLTEFDPPTPLRDVAENIEKWLADVDEPVDLRIAEFAKRQASARQNDPNPT
jgi:hypothetical protein